MRFNHRNNVGIRRATARTDHWAVAYAKANPLKVGASLATLYGLIIIFSYRAYIEYDAAFDIRSLASVIFAAAYVGLLVLFGFSLTLFAPAYFIGAFCIDDECRRTSHGVHRRIAQCFGIAFLAFEGLIALVCLFADKSWAAALIFGSPFLVYVLYALLSAPRSQVAQAFRARLTIARGADSWIAWKFKRMDEFVRSISAQYKANLKLGGSLTVACVVEVVSLQGFFLIMRDSHVMRAKNPDWWQLAWIALMVGMFINIAGAYLVNAWRNPATPRKHRVFATVAALLVPIVAPLVASEFTPVFSLTSMITKTGNFRAAELTLNDDGCRVAADLNRTLCVKTPEGTNKLCNAHVMSRIGSETYLLLSYPEGATAGKNPEQSAQRIEKIDGRIVQHVYLPSKDILGIKPDLSVKVFTKEAIKTDLVKTSSICALPKSDTPKPATSISFAEKDLFEFGDYALTKQGTSTLGNFAQRLIAEQSGALSVDVTGHTDQLGSAHHNLSLSQLRAIAVANFLQSQLDGQLKNVKMNVLGVGSSRTEVPDAACPESMARTRRIACFAHNRRVDVTVTHL